jgi:hypothetical protein
MQLQSRQVRVLGVSEPSAHHGNAASGLLTPPFVSGCKVCTDIIDHAKDLAAQGAVLWWTSAECAKQAGAPGASEVSGRFFGGRWFPREGPISAAQLQALRCARS